MATDSDILICAVSFWYEIALKDRSVIEYRREISSNRMYLDAEFGVLVTIKLPKVNI